MGIQKPQLKSRRRRILLIILPCLLLGLILLVAGIGKLPWLTDIVGTFPGQTEFLDRVFGPLWPTVAFFINNILPWVEVTLGIALILGIFPRIAAILCLPLIAGFMTSNIWAISHGKAFGSCNCFGPWLESHLGNMTPLQSLGIDIALLFLALVIILFHPAGFLTFRWWFSKRKGE